MIDYDDVDDMTLISAFGGGMFFLIIAIVFFFIAFSNDKDCSKKTCPTGATPKLMSHSCLCVLEAK